MNGMNKMGASSWSRNVIVQQSDDKRKSQDITKNPLILQSRTVMLTHPNMSNHKKSAVLPRNDISSKFRQ
jgi:hypothetical protein